MLAFVNLTQFFHHYINFFIVMRGKNKIYFQKFLSLLMISGYYFARGEIENYMTVWLKLSDISQFGENNSRILAKRERENEVDEIESKNV